MATKPRQILAGRTWFVTGRAIDREFRFVPKPKVVETIRYCLAVAAQKYDLQLHSFLWMSNHYHLVLTDTSAQMPDFMRDLNSLMSKALNAIRGTTGQNFERRSYNAIVIADGAKMLTHCAYTESNPCQAHLVESASDWGGVTSAHYDYGDKIAVQRPSYGLWSQGASREHRDVDKHRAHYCGRIKCPEIAEFHLVSPPCGNDCSAETTRALVRCRVQKFEEDARARRKAVGQRVLGMANVRARSYTASPTDPEKLLKAEPVVSSEDSARRQFIKQALKEFVIRYRTALKEYQETGHAHFPEGTWWMTRCLKKPSYAYCLSG